MKKIFLLLTLLFSFDALAFDISDAWGVQRVEGKRILLINHASRAFDSRGAAVKGVSREVKAAHEKQWPVVVLIDSLKEKEIAKSYVPDMAKAKVFLTETGGHNLVFPDKPIFRFAGGHVNFCACRTLRDILLRWKLTGKSEDLSRPLHIELVRDGIYYFPELTDTVDLPERYDLDGNSDGDSANLLDREFIASDKDLAVFLENEYFPSYKGKLSDKDRSMCVDYGDRMQYLYRRDFFFRVLDKSGVELHQFGKKGQPEVIIHLI